MLHLFTARLTSTDFYGRVGCMLTAGQRGRGIALVLVAGLLACVGTARGQAQVQESVAGPIGTGVRYYISPKGAHLVSIALDQGGAVLSVDSQDGLRVDEVIKTDVVGGNAGPNTDMVAFSADGEHHAVMVRIGQGYAIIVDGREIYRAPYFLNAVRGLNFAPNATGGRQPVYFVAATTNPLQGKPDNRLVVDGKPARVGSSNSVVPVFSPDGSRYAYPAWGVEDTRKRTLVVDGADAGYDAERPLFTGDGLQVLAITSSSGATPGQSLLIDGKPALTGLSIARAWTAPAGPRWAAAVRKQGATQDLLVVDGAEVADAQGVTDVIFSPDGRRYAAKCRTPQSKMFMVIDGQKGPEMLGMDGAWTPDSSKFVYTATDGPTHVVVTGSQSSEAYPTPPTKPVLGPRGRVGYTASPQPGKVVVVVDGKASEPLRGSLGLMFSPDGSRYAFTDGLPSAGPASLYLDGVAEPFRYAGLLTPASQPVDGSRPPPVLFSDDGAHVAYMGVPPTDPSGVAIVVDGKTIRPASPAVSRGTFTPDGKHLFWVTWESPRYTVFCDGQPLGVGRIGRRSHR